MKITKKAIREVIDTARAEEICHCTHVTTEEYNKIKEAMQIMRDEQAVFETQKEYINRLYSYLNS